MTVEKKVKEAKANKLARSGSGDHRSSQSQMIERAHELGIETAFRPGSHDETL